MIKKINGRVNHKVEMICRNCGYKKRKRVKDGEVLDDNRICPKCGQETLVKNFKIKVE